MRGRSDAAGLVPRCACLIAPRDLAPSSHLPSAALRQLHIRSMAASHDGYVRWRVRQAICPRREVAPRRARGVMARRRAKSVAWRRCASICRTSRPLLSFFRSSARGDRVGRSDLTWVVRKHVYSRAVVAVVDGCAGVRVDSADREIDGNRRQERRSQDPPQRHPHGLFVQAATPEGRTLAFRAQQGVFSFCVQSNLSMSSCHMPVHDGSWRWRKQAASRKEASSRIRLKHGTGRKPMG